MKKTLAITLVTLVLAGVYVYFTTLRHPQQPAPLPTHVTVEQSSPTLAEHYYTTDIVSGDHVGETIPLSSGKLGAEAVSQPSEYQAFLNEAKTEAHSDTTLKVDTITLKDGTTLSAATLGTTIVLGINPGRSNAEIVKCTGLTTATKTFTGCVFGYKFDGTNTATSANIKAHSPGEPVVITNHDLFFNQVYVQRSASTTIDGFWRFATSTAPQALGIGDGTNNYSKRIVACTGTYSDCSSGTAPYLEYNVSFGKWLISNNGSSTYDPASGGSGLTAESSIVLQASVIKLATSTVSGLVYSPPGGTSGLQVNPGYGLTLASDNQLKVATTTATTWNFGGPVTFSNTVSLGSATSTVFYATQQCYTIGVASCVSDLRNKANATSSDIIISNTGVKFAILPTTTIPALELGTTTAMRITLFFDGMRTDTAQAGGNGATVRLKFGGQTLAATTTNAMLTTTSNSGKMEFYIQNMNSLSSQRAQLYVDGSDDGGGQSTSPNQFHWHATGTGTVDTSQAQNLTVTWQWTAANVSSVVNFRNALVEYIR